jgi:hypothetical protein
MFTHLEILSQKLKISITAIELIIDGGDHITLSKFRKEFKCCSEIYGWIHKESLRVYIGSTKDLSVRPFNHLNYLNRKAASNFRLRNAMQKHGLQSF